jgi:hypothetical protein
MNKSIFPILCLLANGCGGAATHDEEGLGEVEIGSAEQALSEDDGWLRLARLKIYDQTNRVMRTEEGYTVWVHFSPGNGAIMIGATGGSATGTVEIVPRVDCGSGTWRALDSYDFDLGGGQANYYPDDPCEDIDRVQIDSYFKGDVEGDTFNFGETEETSSAERLYIERKSKLNSTPPTRIQMKGGYIKIVDSWSGNDKATATYYNESTTTQTLHLKLNVLCESGGFGVGRNAEADLSVPAGQSRAISQHCNDYTLKETKVWADPI